MKAEELRLGNWVDPKFPMQVTCIYKDEILCNFEGNESDPWQDHPKFLDGIPLTEEWFKKFDFKYSDFLGSWSDKNGKITLEQIDKRFIYDFNLEIKYVHQLQNLYFVLTGEEL